MDRRAVAKRTGMLVPPLLGSLLLLAACGSGTMVAGGGTGGTGISVGTVTATGSITVNGVRFDDTAALITGDNNTPIPDRNFVRREGLTVKVRGRFNADNVTGTAERIEVENEARGTVTSVNPPETFTVLGQTVFVDGATFWANDQGLKLGALTAGTTPVEVHGFRDPTDATGTIRAARVEVLGAPPAEDELRGIVRNKNPIDNTFNIQGSTTVFSFNADTVVVGGPTFDNGALVEVRLNGTLATRIELEDPEDVEFQPGEGEELEVEGFVSGFLGGGDNTFFVGEDREVQLAANVRFEGGLPADFRDGIVVEAKGRFAAGVFVADEIELDDPIRIEANADTAGSANVLGTTVQVTSRTTLVNLPGGISGIPQGAGIKVRGFLNNDNSTITATEIAGLSGPVADNAVVLQGAVTDPDSTGRTLVILGITVDASAQGVVFRNDLDDPPGGDLPILADEFFAALRLDPTAKAKGTFNAVTNTLTATEVELE